MERSDEEVGRKIGSTTKKNEFKSIFYASHSLFERQIKQKEKCIAKKEVTPSGHKKK